jgi:two-component sensor histidine kinase
VAQAVPLGLILNEAITNAIKYAYPVNAPGIIYISMLTEADQQIDLTIADNGPGLPPGFDVNKVESLGVNLMRGLSKQLAGTFNIANEQGCMINIRFKTEIFSRGVAETQITLT